MLTGHFVVAALLLQTQVSAATSSNHHASLGSHRKEVMERSAREVMQGQDSGLGDTTAANHSDTAGPMLAMEPLPEDYTATQERKIISTFWQALQKRRMKALLACETTLWEIVGQTVKETRREPSPTKVEPTPEPRQTQAADDMIADSQGRHIVDVTEAALEKCYTEMSLRAGQTDPQVEIQENLLRAIYHILDQVEACRAAGGKSPSADTTLVKLDKMKTQSYKSVAPSEMLSILESSLVSASLDKQMCLQSLPLPANRYISLE